MNTIAIIEDDVYIGDMLSEVSFLHDLNPTGQAAQLSTMKIFYPVQWIVCDLVWIAAAGIMSICFQHKNIK